MLDFDFYGITWVERAGFVDGGGGGTSCRVDGHEPHAVLLGPWALAWACRRR